MRSVRNGKGLIVPVLLALCWSWPAHAGTFLGADTFDQGESANYVSLGAPDLEYGHIVGLTSLADVTARARVTWAQNTRVGGVGIGLGSDWRMRFAALGGWQIAAVGKPDLALHLSARDHPAVAPPSTSNTAAICLGNPGIVAGWDGDLPARFSVGVHAPLTVFVAPQATLAIPVYLSVGAEATFASVVPMAQVDLGTTFYRLGGRDDSEVYVRLRLGVGWR